VLDPECRHFQHLALGADKPDDSPHPFLIPSMTCRTPSSLACVLHELRCQ
jgi:hypothetical protein